MPILTTVHYNVVLHTDVTYAQSIPIRCGYSNGRRGGVGGVLCQTVLRVAYVS